MPAGKIIRVSSEKEELQKKVHIMKASVPKKETEEKRKERIRQYYRNYPTFEELDKSLNNGF